MSNVVTDLLEGLALAAKQDALLAELQAKADRDEEQVVTLPANQAPATHVVATLTGVGPHTLYTPALGNRLRVTWVMWVPKDVSQVPYANLALSIGGVTYYDSHSIAKTQVIEGGVDESLIASLDINGASVKFNATLEEFS